MNGNNSFDNSQNNTRLNVSEADSCGSDRKTPRHLAQGDDISMEDENNARTPDVTTGRKIIEILNSTRKKKDTPDYSGISHRRTYRGSSSRFAPMCRRTPANGPIFISFKNPNKGGVLVETDHYDENVNLSFFDQAFMKPRCIGKGSFGEVFKAFSKDDRRWYAVKIAVDQFQCELDREKKLKEVQKHELLPKHPNLIEYIRAWEEMGFLYIQTELCQCSLLDYKMKIKVIPERELWFIYGDVALAVRYLHSYGLLHLDIKPQNIMISYEGICKLGDFSLIFDIEKDKKPEEEGDAKYLAPEVLRYGSTKASDIFALGMSMIDICTDLELPTSGELWHGFRNKNIYSAYISSVPPAFLKAILPLLEIKPSERPTAEEICCSPTVAACIAERQAKYLARNMWWIGLTVGYSSLFATSWIVQPALTVMIHGLVYLKRKRTRRHRVFRATCEQSPIFKIKATNPLPRLHLTFDDDEEDYDYAAHANDNTDDGDGDDDRINGSGDNGGNEDDGGGSASEENRMETSECEDDVEDELLNVMEASVVGELLLDEAGSCTQMEVDAPSSSSMESVRRDERSNNQPNGFGGDANSADNTHNSTSDFYGCGAAGDASQGNVATAISVLPWPHAPMKHTDTKRQMFEPAECKLQNANAAMTVVNSAAVQDGNAILGAMNVEAENISAGTPNANTMVLDVNAMDNEENEIPSTSNSLIERPKTPEPPPSEEASPQRDGYVTPPCGVNPPSSVTKTPIRGSDARFYGLPGEAEECYARFRTRLRRELGRLNFPDMLESATDNDAASETSSSAMDEKEETEEPQPGPSGIGNAVRGITALPTDDANRRRAHIGNSESAPPAKRAAQMVNGNDGNDCDDGGGVDNDNEQSTDESNAREKRTATDKSADNGAD